MNSQYILKTRGWIPFALLVPALGLFAAFLACSSPATVPSQVGKTGSQLWSETCASCHNAHPSTLYSNAQWEVVSRHMRVAANITGEDARKIESFLKGGK